MNADSFLQAMRDEPDDMGLRLVFADWLEDNGEPEKAELIRLQCSALPRPLWDDEAGTAGTPRERELIERVVVPWLGSSDFRWHGYAVFFRRGMAQLHVRPAALETPEHRDHVRILLGSGWVERFCLTYTSDECLYELAGWPELQLIPSLRISTSGDGSGLKALLRRLVGLRHLFLSHIEPTAELAEVLAGLLRLDALRWEGYPERESPLCLSPRTLPLLKPCLNRCRVLGLDGHDLGELGLAALLDLLPRGAIRELDLSRNQLAPPSIRRLAVCEDLRGLHALRLHGNPVRDEGARLVASAEPLSGLRHLDLSIDQYHRGEIGPAGVEALAGSAVLARLESLNLSNNPLGPEGARILAASPHLGRLRRLDLRACSIDEAGARALVLSGSLGSLSAIDLTSNPIGHLTWQEAGMLLEEWRRYFTWPEDDRSPETVRAMCAVLAGNDPVALRRLAVQSLGQLWRQRQDDLPAEVEPLLVHAMDDADEDIRDTADEALQAARPRGSLLPLLNLLASTYPYVIERGAEMIAALDPGAWQFDEALLARLDSPQLAMRDEVIKALVAVEGTSVVPGEVYRRWLRGDDRGLRLVAAGSLARVGQDLDGVLSLWQRLAPLPDPVALLVIAPLARWPEALRRVLRHAGDHRPGVRAAVADVLGHAETKDEVVATLTRLLDDSVTSVRLRACQAIEHAGHQALAFIEPLGRCLAEAHLQAGAIGALARQGAAAAAVTPAVLRAGLEGGQAAAFRLLRDLGEATRPHAEAFREALRHPSAEQARRAGLALRQCARCWRDGAVVLTAWLDDPSPAVRTAAAAALRAV